MPSRFSAGGDEEKTGVLHPVLLSHIKLSEDLKMTAQTCNHAGTSRRVGLFFQLVDLQLIGSSWECSLRKQGLVMVGGPGGWGQFLCVWWFAGSGLFAVAVGATPFGTDGVKTVI